MAGQLDSAFRQIAKQVVSDLGNSFDNTITYTRKVPGTYNTSTGATTTTDTTFSDLKVPIEFIRSEDDLSLEIRQAKIYITPDLIGDNQPTKSDEIILNYAGANRTVQIITIDTKKGGQTYLFTLLVRF